VAGVTGVDGIVTIAVVATSKLKLSSTVPKPRDISRVILCPSGIRWQRTLVQDVMLNLIKVFLMIAKRNKA
jgi:hypothetical protein